MQAVTLTVEEIKVLLNCKYPDAVALYLYRKANEPLELAMEALGFDAPRMRSSADTLRRLGLWDSMEKSPMPQPERPKYTETDVHNAMGGQKGEFSKLVGEAQRRLGRTLSTEELKILLSFVDYLRMPVEVAALLISYCVERSRRRNGRTPSMRSVEKEAYHWADEGIDTLEAAIHHMQTQMQIQTRVSHLRNMMQIQERRLTQAEEQYLTSWITMGFPDDVIKLAYEKTCVNTGGLKWAYMNSILKSWNEKNLHTLRDISAGDGAPKRKGKEINDMYQRHSHTTVTPLEREAIQRALEEG